MMFNSYKKELASECIADACRDYENLLRDKNNSYSCSVFKDGFDNLSGLKNEHKLLVMIENKIYRIIAEGATFETEDNLVDLAGYIILLKAVRKFNTKLESAVEN